MIPGRNAHHAVKCISDILHKNVKQYGGLSPGEKALQTWILDADISKCFDNINHKALLNKIHQSSPFFKTIRKWLQVGTITTIGFKRSYKGTPQGGVISPLLANIALHGLEELFGIYTDKTKNECPDKKKYLSPSMRRRRNKWISLVRYADDFVVIARADSDRRIKSYILPKIRQFLREVGLEINQAKTKIVNAQQGFTFLGFKFRFRKDLNSTTYWPDRARIDRSLRKLSDFVMMRKRIHGSEMPQFIANINRRIKGIIRYYGWSQAWGTISYIGHRVWKLMYKWSLKRHPKRGKKWVRNYYFTHPPWETFTFKGARVIISYKYWRNMTKAQGWWGIKQIKIRLSPFDQRWNNIKEEGTC